MAVSFFGFLFVGFESYSNEGYILEIQQSYENASWFLALGKDLVFYYLIIAIGIIRIFKGNCMKEQSEKNLFSFLLLFLSFVNFGIEIPSFGGRFQVLFFLFAITYLFLYFVKKDGTKINLLILAGLFPMVMYSAIIFRTGSDSINAWIFAPGIGLPLAVPGLSIANMLFN